MSNLQMQQEDHPVHDVPRPTEDYKGVQLADTTGGNYDVPRSPPANDNNSRGMETILKNIDRTGSPMVPRNVTILPTK